MPRLLKWSEGEHLFAAAKKALQAARESKLTPIPAASLGSIGTVSTRSSFRKVLSRILKSSPDHPLSFLLDASGKLRSSTSRGLTGDVLLEMPEIVEAGHAVSAKSLTGAANGTDRFMA